MACRRRGELDSEIEMSSPAEAKASPAEAEAEAESKEKSVVDLGGEGSSKTKRKSKLKWTIEDAAQAKIELEKWKQVLLGQQFVRDKSKPFPGQYKPVDQSVCWASLMLTLSIFILVFKPLTLSLTRPLSLTPPLDLSLRLVVDVDTECFIT